MELLFSLLAWSWKAPELCGISPFTLHPRKVQCRQSSDLPRSDLTGGRARPRASSLCPARPLLSACLLLWPKPQACRGGCWPNPLPTHSLRFATHRAASPALGPTNLWKLESVSPQQKTVVSGLPFPPGGSWAPNLQSLYPQQGSVSAKSESVSSPSAPSEAGTFPPWLLPKPQTQVLLSSRRGLDLAFPWTLNPHSFWGGRGGGRG